MKDLLTLLKQRMNTLKGLTQKKKEMSIQKLDTLKGSVGREIDIYLDKLYEKKNYIEKAFKKRKQLRRFHESFLYQLFFRLKLRHILSAPFIYGIIIPTIIFHIALEIYHQICFRLYGIPPIPAKEFFFFDRQLLSYLNWFEKINCVYCSYFNALIAYAREIAAHTERYWCPIKHAQRRKDPHSQYEYFFDYLDGSGYRSKRLDLRKYDR